MIDPHTIPDSSALTQPHQALAPNSLLYRALGSESWRVEAPSTKARRLQVHHYQILHAISQGGFGTTYLACDPSHPNRQKCVIKQLFAPMGVGRKGTTGYVKGKSNETDVLRKRFLYREARVLTKLGQHPQIPRLLESFEGEGGFYIVLDYIEGKALKEVLVAGQYWSAHQTIEFLKQMLEVLRFIHNRRVIHRDIKPSNIVRADPSQTFCLIDFGAAKQLLGQWGNTATAIGSRGYASPEQMRGHPRMNSDIYALGIVALEAVSGIPAYHLHDGGAEGPVPLDSYPIDPGLSAILRNMVVQDWRSRYATAEDVLYDLMSLST